MNLNILLVPCILLLTEVESMLESSPLEHISELEPETRETRTLDCCSAAMSALTTNIDYELDNVSNTLRNAVQRIDGQIQRHDYTLNIIQSSLNDLDRRRGDKIQRRDHTLNSVENDLNHMNQRRRVVIEAESMLESSPLEDIIELKPETKETRTLNCCSAAEIDISKIMVHKLRVVSAAIQDAETQINENIRIRDHKIRELQIKYNYLDGRIQGK